MFESFSLGSRLDVGFILKALLIMKKTLHRFATMILTLSTYRLLLIKMVSDNNFVDNISQ